MLPNIYYGDYRKLIILPIALIILSLFFIPQIKLGIDFTGGTLIVLDLNEEIQAEKLESYLKQQGIEAKVKTYTTSFGPKAEIEIELEKNLSRAEILHKSFNSLLENVSRLEIEKLSKPELEKSYLEQKALLFSYANELFLIANLELKAENFTNLNHLQSAVNNAYFSVFSSFEKKISASLSKVVSFKEISINTVSPALSSHFIENAIKVAIFAALLSIFFVFLFFRSFVPSFAVILGAFSDIIIALGAIGFFGIKFTLATFAALLMILGFSLDTDILLTMRVLKRQGDAREKAFDAMKTGITMSITAIFAFSILYIISLFTHISMYSEIASVALAGLVGDIFATWFLNAVIIIMHAEGKI